MAKLWSRIGEAIKVLWGERIGPLWDVVAIFKDLNGNQILTIPLRDGSLVDVPQFGTSKTTGKACFAVGLGGKDNQTFVSLLAWGGYLFTVADAVTNGLRLTPGDIIKFNFDEGVRFRYHGFIDNTGVLR